ncbi:MAG TPA: redoxin domain-containing protein [Candidatus Sulfotelmatobacter sp.]|jgi:thiol-disulfide isomerase/thioredoxin|nr:redoxin domain-containing protein [Candidatus Sulfotelmatobacter sp.]
MMIPILLAAAAPFFSPILDKPVPEWPEKAASRWINSPPLTLAGLRGKVVLIRFFMESECPYCRATAPSLNEFHREFASQGLVVIGMYTPKPKPRPVTTDEVRKHVAAYGFAFPVAVDDDWGADNRLWLDRVPEAEATSASLLIDRKGVLRHVQEGGEYAKTSADPKARADYEAMRAAIIRLLAER